MTEQERNRIVALVCAYERVGHSDAVITEKVQAKLNVLLLPSAFTALRASDFYRQVQAELEWQEAIKVVQANPEAAP